MRGKFKKVSNNDIYNKQDQKFGINKENKHTICLRLDANVWNSDELESFNSTEYVASLPFIFCIRRSIPYTLLSKKQTKSK